MPDSASLPLAGKPSARHDPAATLTSQQIRAARALLRWNHMRLAEAARVGIATVYRAEAADGVPSIQTRTLMSIQAALEKAGVIFLDAGASEIGGIGVRLKG